MPSVSRLLGGLGQGVGALLTVAFLAAQAGLFVGGVSYRKDCVNEQGRVAKAWQFTWFAPIPYLFRPDEPGCVIHTGTRVALNAVGIAKFDETTATNIADEAVRRSNPGAEGAYWVKLRGAVEDYGNRNENVADLDAGLRSVNTLLGQLGNFSVPSRYAHAHGDLVSALQQVRRHGEDMRAAAEADNIEAFERAQRTTVPDAERIQRAMKRFNLAHARG